MSRARSTLRTGQSDRARCHAILSEQMYHIYVNASIIRPHTNTAKARTEWMCRCRRVVCVFTAYAYEYMYTPNKHTHTHAQHLPNRRGIDSNEHPDPLMVRK